MPYDTIHTHTHTHKTTHHTTIPIRFFPPSSFIQTPNPNARSSPYHLSPAPASSLSPSHSSYPTQPKSTPPSHIAILAFCHSAILHSAFWSRFTHGHSRSLTLTVSSAYNTSRQSPSYTFYHTLTTQYSPITPNPDDSFKSQFHSTGDEKAQLKGKKGKKKQTSTSSFTHHGLGLVLVTPRINYALPLDSKLLLLSLSLSRLSSCSSLLYYALYQLKLQLQLQLLPSFNIPTAPPTRGR
jgi:hypothetical protein